MIKAMSATVVLIPGQQVNTAQFSQLWFVENKIVASTDFASAGSIFLPVVTNVVSPKFDLLVMPNRVQLTLKGSADESNDVLTGAFRRFLDACGISFSSIGLNFNSVIAATEGSTAPAARRLFLSNSNPLSKIFRSDESSAGLYVTKPIDGGRMQIDIKPGSESVDGNLTPGLPQVLIAATNYHFDVMSRDQIGGILHRSSELLDEAKRCVQDLNDALFN